MKPRSRRVVLCLYRCLGSAVDVTLGRCCPVCRRPLYVSRYRPSGICRACSAAFHRSHLQRTTVCATCGRVLVGELSVCTTCRRQESVSHFVNHKSCFEYAGEGRALIDAFKMQAVQRVSRLAAELMVPTVPKVDLIVPTPSGSKAGASRTFEPVEELSRILAGHLAIPSLRALEKRGGGIDQKKLNKRERAHNVRDRFRLRPEASGIAGRSICLIDDVYTTGATAQECSRMLLQGGAACVYVRTLAID